MSITKLGSYPPFITVHTWLACYRTASIFNSRFIKQNMITAFNFYVSLLLILTKKKWKKKGQTTQEIFGNVTIPLEKVNNAGWQCKKRLLLKFSKLWALLLSTLREKLTHASWIKTSITDMAALIPLLFICSQGIENHLGLLNQRTLSGNSYTLELL